MSRRRAGTVLLLATTVLALPLLAAAAPLLRNGAFTEGAGGLPQDWRTEAWARDVSTFAWEVAPDGTGQVRITSPEPNDARWCQRITVVPGATYRVSARVRTSGIGSEHAGALLAVEPRVADTPDIRGTQDWQTIEVLAQAREGETAWEICPRLGSYANLNTGTAWFTDVAVEQLTAPASHPLREWLARHQVAGGPTAGWRELATPILGGVLLAWGLGIGRRR